MTDILTRLHDAIDAIDSIDNSTISRMTDRLDNDEQINVEITVTDTDTVVGISKRDGVIPFDW